MLKFLDCWLNLERYEVGDFGEAVKNYPDTGIAFRFWYTDDKVNRKEGTRSVGDL
jgi:hypothetical protein